MLDKFNRYLCGYVGVPILNVFIQRGILRHISANPKCSIKKISESLQLNEGYFRASLNLFLSLNWITIDSKDCIILQEKLLPGNLISTETLNFLYQDDVFDHFFTDISLKYLINCRDYLLANQAKYSEQICDILDGPLLVTLLISLARKQLDINKLSLPTQKVVKDILIIKNFYYAEKFTEQGQYALEHNMVLGIAASYRSMLRQVGTLLYGNPADVHIKDKNGIEQHVDRTLNIIASGYQHQKYFSDIEDLVIKIFDNNNLENQPRYIVDMGCGDGAFLKYFYQIVCLKTLRGKHIDKYPLILVGVDINAESLSVAGNNLKDTQHLLLSGDISKPRDLLKYLQVNNINPSDCLHIRSFLDHELDFNEELINGYEFPKSINTYIGKHGEAVTSNKIKERYLQHFKSWSELAGKHGLIVLEVHSVASHIASKYLDECESPYFDLLQAFSGQKLLNASDFSKLAAQAGLFVEPSFFKFFPRRLPFTRITINWLHKKNFSIRYANKNDLAQIVSLEKQCWDIELQSEERSILSLIKQFGVYVIEYSGILAGAVYTQRIANVEDLYKTNFASIQSLHHAKNTILQLIKVNVLPEHRHLGLGKELIAFVLHISQIQEDISEVVGVTRCVNYNKQNSNESYVEYVNKAKDPMLKFHLSLGAEIVGVVANYRNDSANLNNGVLIKYVLDNILSKKITFKEDKKVTAAKINSIVLTNVINQHKPYKSKCDFKETLAFFDMGFDSLDLTELNVNLNESLNIHLDTSVFFKYPTTKSLAHYVQSLFNNKYDKAKIQSSKQLVLTDSLGDECEIAIIGMSCRLPGKIYSLQDFWNLLNSGETGIVELPKDREELWQKFVEFDAGSPSFLYGGYLDDIDKFDPYFFGISPREAVQMDPQHRILLELHWEALEHALIRPTSLAKTNTGVYVGLMSQEYGLIKEKYTNLEIDKIYEATGTAEAIAAGRISYFLDLIGPSLVVNTACSSSLVAIHLACQGLKLKETDLALASGVNLIITPQKTSIFSSANMLSKNGQSRVFDSDASGYVRGEGVGVLVLKRLNDALCDKDNICAVIRASGINQDGASNGLTAPSQLSQEILMRDVLELSNCAPDDVDYIEAHGTGTILGDPIELASIQEVYAKNRSAKKPLYVGSVKSNLGHLESAAGIAGVIKTVLMLQQHKMPKNINYTNLNPNISIDERVVKILDKTRDWKKVPNKKRIAGVSSFGFSGTNAHIILSEAEDYSRQTYNELREKEPERIELLILSAKTEDALKRCIASYRKYLESTNFDLRDIAYSMSLIDTGAAYRTYFLGKDIRDICNYIDDKQFIITSIENDELKYNSALDYNSLSHADFLEVATKQYLQGAVIDFTLLYKNCLKVNLPVYPFARNTYWYSYVADPIQHGFISGLPIVIGSKKTYSFELSLAQNTYLKDHNVFDNTILPGSVFVEFCLEVLKSSLPKNITLCIKDVVFDKVLNLSVFNTVKVEIIKDADAITVYSINNRKERLLHFYAKNSLEYAGLKNRFDIYKAVTKCQETLSKDEIYSHISKTGLAYGDSFKKIESLYLIKDRTLGKVVVPGDNLYISNPIVLDCCFQVVAALISIHKELKSDTYIPVSIGEFTIFDRLPNNVWASIKQDEFKYENSRVVVTLDIYSDSGELVARASDLCLLKVTVNSFIENNKIFYTTSWSEFKPEMQSSAKKVGKNNWLLVTNNNQLQKIFKTNIKSTDIELSTLLLGTVIEFSEQKRYSRIIYAPCLPEFLDVAEIENWSIQYLLFMQSIIKSITSLNQNFPHLDVLLVDDLQSSILIGSTKSLQSEYKEWDIRLLVVDTILNFAKQFSKMFAMDTGVENRFKILGEKIYVERLESSNLDFDFTNYVMLRKFQDYKWLSGADNGISSVKLFKSSFDKITKDKVRVEIKSVGLNFKDVLTAMQLEGLEEKEIGIDFAGIILEVGDNVNDFKVGDRVIGITKGACASKVDVLPEYIQKLPSSLTYIEGASIPTIFMTSFYALFDLAKIKASEKILIHTASGGVGLAAIAYAKTIGAEIYATAGSDIKRKYLKSLGIKYVYDSRNLNFVERLLADSKGAGVDIVLNTLTGPGFIDASLSCCSSGARFIEISKFNIFSSEQIASINSTIKYEVFELDNNYFTNPNWGKDLFNRSLSYLQRFAINVPPITKLQFAQLPYALKYLQRAKHIGKIILTNEQQEFPKEDLYIITGGLSGIGYELCKYLVANKIKNIAILSRSLPSEEQLSYFADQASQAVCINYYRVDVSDYKYLSKTFKEIQDTQGTIKHIIHSAGVISDASVLNQDANSFNKVFLSKVYGGWYLHELSKNLDVESFVVFSSVASILGTAGQSNYVAANSFLDKLIEYRRALGLPGLSINWGAWSEVGMALSSLKSHTSEVRTSLGLLSFKYLFSQSDIQRICVMQMNWDAYFEKVTGPQPLLTAFKPQEVRVETRGFIDELNKLPQSSGQGLLASKLTKILAKVLQYDGEAVLDKNSGFFNLGLDSLTVLEFKKKIESALDNKVKLGTEIFFNYTNIRELSQYIYAEITDSNQTQVEVTSNKSSIVDDIAIISMDCRFPGNSNSLEEYWGLLSSGIDGISNIPNWRESSDNLHVMNGGFINDIDKFDADFFNISPREAKLIDPQHRLLLESTERLLRNSFIPLDEIRNSNTGVYIGISTSDYSQLMYENNDKSDLSLYLMTGLNSATASGRISYFYGLEGPSISIDTACSSSLVSTHIACNSLLSGEINMAIVGGVSVLCDPRTSMAFYAGGMLAKDGRCKTFDASADGYVRSEGCGLVLLKRKQDALRDGDNILALIKGSAINQDGSSSGLTVPNGRNQEKVIRTALANSGLNADDISYVEAHGTGTPLGDPIEIKSLINAYETKERSTPLEVGSVKTQIGHLEAAAGVAGLIKVVLMLQHKELVKNLHFNSLNPEITLDGINIKTATSSWDVVNDKPRIAGISSFGFSGTNAHIILSEAEGFSKQTSNELREKEPGRLELLVLSAKTEDALKRCIDNYRRYLETTNFDLRDIAYSMSLIDTGAKYRTYFIGRDLKDVCKYITDNLYKIAEYGGEKPEEINLNELSHAAFIGAAADLYLSGAEVNFSLLYENCRKVELPNYPFARNSYWFKSIAHSAKQVFINSSPQNEGSNTVYSFDFSLENFSLFKEHIIYDQVIFPGTGLIEICLEVLTSINPNSSVFVIKDIAFDKALNLTLDSKVKLEVIKSYDELSINSINSRLEHLQHFRAKIVNDIDYSGSKINISEEVKACKRQLSKDEFYSYINTTGFTYGDSFKRLESVYFFEDRALAKVKGPAESKYISDPDVLDCCLQSIFSLISLNEELKNDTYIPISIGMFILLQKLPSEIWVSINLADFKVEKSSIVVSLDLHDADGKLIAHLAKLCLLKLNPNVFNQDNKVFYTTRWLEYKAEDSSSVNNINNERWLLIGNDKDLVKILKEDLKNRGIKLSTQSASSKIELGVDNQFVRIVYCVSSAELSDISQVENLALQLLAFVQSILLPATSLKQSLPALDVLLFDNLQNAVLNGMVKSIQNEYSDMNIRLFSIDNLSYLEKDFSKIFTVDTGFENQFKFIEGQLFIPRLAVSELNSKKSSFFKEFKDKQTFPQEDLYIITGGLSGIGYELCKYLVANKIKNIAILSRSLPSEEQLSYFADQASQAVCINYYRVDVSDYKYLSKTFKEIQDTQGTIKHIIHSAGVISDASVLNQDANSFNKVFLSKVYGGWYLHELSKNLDVESFVVFSSVASILGTAGQSNYVAANSFLDKLIEYRRALGLPGLSINWGAWSEVGMALSSLKSHTSEVRTSLGLLSFKYLFSQSDIQRICVMQMNWDAYFEKVTGPQPLLTAFKPQEVRVETRGFIDELNKLPQSSGQGLLASKLTKILAKVLQYDGEAVLDKNSGFFNLGLDSLTVLEFKKKIESALDNKVKLGTEIFFNYTNIRELSQYIYAEITDSNQTQVEVTSNKSSIVDDIAIISMDCRFPGNSNSLEEYWGLLSSGIDGISNIPNWRESSDNLHVMNGGFINDIDKFDADFFNISPREAKLIDPQHRLLLESTERLLRNSFIPLDEIRNSNTGVYIGISTSDYSQLMYENNDKSDLSLYLMTGLNSATASGRISYFYGLEGPSISIDTACSSSLVSTHIACNSLLSGEINMAIVGGVSVLCDPRTSMAFYAGGMLAKDGRCKTFDASADGYVRSEGCGLVLLKRKQDALRDGDNILALIKGSAINQDGSSSGLTVPNGRNQEKVIRTALANSGLNADDISYVEAHGTGTPLGDPIEIKSLINAYETKERSTPLEVGSVKTQIGHLEAAAGVAGLIKVVLMLQHKELVKNLHFNSLNPEITLDGINIKTATSSWDVVNDKPRIAGISSFGFSGTNAHIILSEAEGFSKQTSNELREKEPGRLELLVLSAKTEDALKRCIDNYRRYLETTNFDLRDIAYSMSLIDTGAKYRTYFIGRDLKDVCKYITDNLYKIAEYGGEKPEEINLNELSHAAFIGAAADLYLSGAEVNFSLLYENCRKVELPNYPFARNSYWFKDIFAKEQNFLSNQYITKKPKEIDNIKTYSFDLSFVKYPYLQDHVVYEKVIFPATGYIECCLEVIAHTGSEISEYIFENIQFIQPLELDLEHSQNMKLLLSEDNNNHLNIGIYILKADNYESLCCQALVKEHKNTIIKSIDIQKETQDSRTHYNKEDIYKVLNSLDVHYGTQFQGIHQAIVKGSSLFVEVRLGNNSDCLAYPPLLDSCLQAIYLFMYEKNILDSNTYVPEKITKFQLFQDLPDNLWVKLNLDSYEFAESRITLSFKIFDENGGLVAIIEDFIACVVGKDHFKGEDGTSCYYQLKWISLSDANTYFKPQEVLNTNDLDTRMKSNIDLDIKEESNFNQVSKKLVVFYFIQALVKLYPDLRCGLEINLSLLNTTNYINAKYHQLIRYLINILVSEKYCDRIGEKVILSRMVTVDNLYSRFFSKFGNKYRIELELLRRCGENLADILIGDIEPLDLLFGSQDDISAKDLYYNSYAYLKYNECIAKKLSQFLEKFPKDRNLRILEIGAGTGSTTASLLPVIQSSNISATYVFTDISDSFFTEAQRIFNGYKFLKYHVLDIEQDISAQGLVPYQFDIVIAANVIHATSSIIASLNNIKELLTAGGYLFLLEASKHTYFADLTFGLLDGWWKFRDNDLRQAYPLIDANKWEDTLNSAGFDSHLINSSENGQAILVAKKTHIKIPSVECKQTWALFFDDINFASSFEKTLSAFDIELVKYDLNNLNLDSVFDDAILFNRFIFSAFSTVSDMEQVERRTLDLLDIAKRINVFFDKKIFTYSPLDIILKQDNSTSSLVNGAIHGFVKSLQNEYLNWKIRIIEALQPKSFDDLAYAIWSLSITNANENILRVKSNEIQVQRLYSNHDLKNEQEIYLAIKNNDKYKLISGGNINPYIQKLELENYSLKEKEVLVTVKYSGLNFKDYLFPTYLFDFSGEVIKVGKLVTRYAVGDYVFGCALVGRSSEIIIHESNIKKVPLNMGLKEAAGLPTIYITAYYCLHTLAKLKSTDSILIHSASGGVGTAAINYAKSVGADVYVTTSSPYKIEYLTKLGVKRIYNSRDTNFDKQLLVDTNGRGVDVVLNSLTGPGFIQSTLNCCAMQARFIEISILNVWSEDKVNGCRPDIEYHLVKIDDNLSSNSSFSENILSNILEWIETNNISPLHIRTYPVFSIKKGLNRFLSPTHTGKIVLDHGLSLHPNNGVYLITGGLSEIGYKIFQHLVSLNVSQIALISRGEPSQTQKREFNKCKDQGITVKHYAVDISDFEKLRLVFEQINLNQGDVSNIIHCAGVLSDATLLNNNKDYLSKTFKPKVHGAWNLHLLTQQKPVDSFLVFSSISWIIGSSGQANHSAVNAFLSYFISYRRAHGMSGVCINWPVWEGAGAIKNSNLKQKQYGLKNLKSDDALDVFDFLTLNQKYYGDVTLLDIDWSIYITNNTIHPLLLNIIGHYQNVNVSQNDIVDELLKMSYDSAKSRLLSVLGRDVSRILHHNNTVNIDPEVGFFDLGMDSLTIIEFRQSIEGLFANHFKVTPQLLFEYTNLNQLSEFLVTQIFDLQQDEPQTSLDNIYAKNDIAIVSLDCHFPGDSNSPSEYWEMLVNGVDAITEVPSSRWDINEYYSEDREEPGKMYTSKAGFMSNIDLFDAKMFNLSPKEAKLLDPQQRILLEVTHNIFTKSSFSKQKLKGSRTGVFIGLSATDYVNVMRNSLSSEDMDLYLQTGNSPSTASGRISFYFGLEGPSVTIDTACSSSLVSIHMACQSLISGESDLALAGGVSLNLDPIVTVSFCKSGMISQDGKCKTFDASADGFVRSEGCGLVLLKRKQDAVRDGDNILAIIKGSAINQDGSSSGLTVPNCKSQEKVIRTALENSGLNAEDISYVEAHGTGTRLGDPIEIKSLTNAYVTNERSTPLEVGSVKTQIGHLEAASGVAGLIKVVLMLQHKELVKNLHFNNLNPEIELHGIKIITATSSWGVEVGKPRIAGISSFGFSGTNAHIILSEADDSSKQISHQSKLEDQDRLEILVLSAKTEDALIRYIQVYRRYLESTSYKLKDIAYSMSLNDSKDRCRVCLLGYNIDDVCKYIDGKQYDNDVDKEDNSQPLNLSDLSHAEFIDSAVKLYLRGIDVDFSHLYENCYKVELPSYPFAKKSYWFKDKFAKNISARVGPFITNEPEEKDNSKIYSFELSLTEYPYLQDHVVYEKVIFPATGYIEICLEILANYGIQISDYIIQSIQFVEPLMLDLGKPQAMQIIVFSDGNSLNINIYKHQEDKTNILCCNAIVLESKNISEQSIDIAKDTQSAKKYYMKEEVYNIISSTNISHDTHFQGIHQAIVTSEHLFIEVILQKSADYLAYPPLLDSCLQAIYIFLHEQNILNGTTYAPEKIINFKLLRPLPAHLWVKFTLGSYIIEDQKGCIGLEVFDNKGRLIAYFEKVIGSRINQDNLHVFFARHNSNTLLDKSVVSHLNTLSKEEAIEYIKLSIANKLRVLLEYEDDDVLDFEPGFFELGLDSIRTIDLKADIEELFAGQIKLDYADFVTYSNIELLAHYVHDLYFASALNALSQDLKRAPSTNTNEQQIIAVSENDEFPLGANQSAIYFLSQISEKNNVTYNEQLIISLAGPIDIDKIKYALYMLTERHGALRTQIMNVNGSLSQKQLQHAMLPIEVLQVESYARLNEIILAEKHKPFIFSKAPIAKAIIVNNQGHSCKIIFTAHHLVIDVWSYVVLEREFLELYQGLIGGVVPELPRVNKSYKDYIAHRTMVENSQKYIDGIRYWRQKLHDYEESRFIADNIDTDKSEYTVNNYSLVLSERETKLLKEYVKKANITPFAFINAMIFVLLARLTYQSDIIVGSMIANREDKEFENTVGFFASNIVYRYSVDLESNVDDYLQSFFKSMLEAREYSYVSFVDIVKNVAGENSDKKNPLFQILINEMDFSKRGQKTDLNSLQLIDIKLPFVIHFLKADSHFEIVFLFDKSLNKKGLVLNFVNGFYALINDLLSKPKQKIGTYNILPYQQRMQIIDVDSYSKGNSCKVHRMFEDKVIDQGKQSCLISQDLTLTYKDLNVKANKFAKYLVKYGEKYDYAEGSRVAVYLDYSIETFISILAILKANMVIVYIDSSEDSIRVNQILEDSGAVSLITNHKYISIFSKYTIPCIEVTETLYANECGENIQIDSSKSDLAIIVYKKLQGVMVTHQNILNFVRWSQSTVSDEAGYIVDYYTNQLVDSVITGVLSALILGYQVALFEKSYESWPYEYADFIDKYKVASLRINHQNLHSLLTCLSDADIQDKLAGLDTILLVISSEFNKKNVSRILDILPNINVYLCYAPMEMPGICLSYKVSSLDDLEFNNIIPFGNVDSLTKAYITDEYDNILPNGVVGELCISGAGLVKGYNKNHALTLEKFLPNIFIDDFVATNNYKKIYKTGISARYLANGNIEVFLPYV